jgi:hypothetical protein
VSRQSYIDYLNSPTWRRIRKAALIRDRHTCRACGDPAQHVHHDRYPNTLGQEKQSWLYSLCADCHAEIHAIVDSGVNLKSATRHVVMRTNTPIRKKKQRKVKKKVVTTASVKRLQAHFKNGPSANTRFKSKIHEENEKMRATLLANKRRREARKGLQ